MLYFDPKFYGSEPSLAIYYIFFIMFSKLNIKLINSWERVVKFE